MIKLIYCALGLQYPLRGIHPKKLIQLSSTPLQFFFKENYFILNFFTLLKFNCVISQWWKTILFNSLKAILFCIVISKTNFSFLSWINWDWDLTSPCQFAYSRGLYESKQICLFHKNAQPKININLQNGHLNSTVGLLFVFTPVKMKGPNK